MEQVVKCATTILENVVEGGEMKYDGVIAIPGIFTCVCICVWRKVTGWWLERHGELVNLVFVGKELWRCVGEGARHREEGGFHCLQSCVL